MTSTGNPPTQLISVSPEGEISTVRRKKDSGLDLREIGGDFDMKRVSLICWIDPLQGFVVELQVPRPFPQRHLLSVKDLQAAGIPFSYVCKSLQGNGPSSVSHDSGVKFVRNVWTRSGVLCFQEYEEAAKIEVLYLDAAKAKGVCPVWG